MSMARRMGAAGIRRGVRVSNAPPLKPWTLVPQTNLVLALDARFGVDIDTGVHPWHDQSSQGNNVSQTTTTKQPAYVTDNGKPGVDFDGVDDLLENRAFSGVTAGDEFTFFCVSRLKVTAQTRWVFGVSDTLDTNNLGVQFLDSNLSGGRYEVQNIGQAVTSAPDDADRHVFTITSQPSLVELFKDGASLGSDTAPTITMRDIVHLVLGVRPSGTLHGSVVVHSLLVYNTMLSAGDRDTVENALGSVWSVAIS